MRYKQGEYLGAIDGEEVREMFVSATETAEQVRDALRSIANSLELLTGCITGDDQGRAAFRIAGEIVGGDGDVREPA